MSNTNMLAEIQRKYAGCNLLLPASVSIQLNPFYKCTVMEVMVDTDEGSGDIFKVGSTRTEVNGRTAYEDVYSLAKPLLMKLATAAGIQFHPEYTTVTKEGANTYIGKAYGAVRLPDGTFKTHAETKRICLDDEQEKFRLEFFDKSIAGIPSGKAANDAASLFRGEWRDVTDKFGKKNKVFVIADDDREKYIERSLLVNMTLLRKTASEKAQTGAILRVIRALLGVKGTYKLAELKKPFAVPTVTFSPDYSDATVRQAMLQQGMKSMGNLFGSGPALPFGEADSFSTAHHTEEAAAETSDSTADSVQEVQEVVVEDMPSAQTSIHRTSETRSLKCENCGADINERVYEYSINRFGKPMCIKCQRGN